MMQTHNTNDHIMINLQPISPGLGPANRIQSSLWQRSFVHILLLGGQVDSHKQHKMTPFAVGLIVL